MLSNKTIPSISSAIIIRLSSTSSTSSTDNKDCKICNYKNSVIFDYQSGESVCKNCGAVIPEDEDITSHSLQGTTHDRSEKESIKNVNYIVNKENEFNQKFGLSTVLYRNNIYHGPNVKVTHEQLENAYRLEKISKMATPNKLRSMYRRDASLVKAINFVLKLRDEFRLTEPITQTAIKYLQKSQKAKLFKGRKTEGMTAACVYIACLEFEIPRTLEEIAAQIGLDITRDMNAVRKCYRVITDKLLLHINNHLNEKNIINFRFLKKYVNIFGLSNKHYLRAVEILNTIKQKDPTALVGTKPNVTELSALVYAYKEKEEEEEEKEENNNNNNNNNNRPKISLHAFASEGNSNMVSIRKNLKIFDKYLK